MARATASPPSNAGPCCDHRAACALGLWRAAAPASAGLPRGLVRFGGSNPIEAPAVIGWHALDRESAPPKTGQGSTGGMREPASRSDEIVERSALGPAQKSNHQGLL